MKLKYKRLFEISLQKDEVVLDMGRWDEGGWRWELLWRRGFFDWENVLVNNLLQKLNRAKIACNVQDAWRWIPDVDGYSVRTAYMAQLSLEDVPACEIFRKICASWVPAKVHAFGWRFALGRFPTLDNLIKRGVLINGGSNLGFFCHNHGESVKHLFFECERCGKLV